MRKSIKYFIIFLFFFGLIFSVLPQILSILLFFIHLLVFFYYILFAQPPMYLFFKDRPVWTSEGLTGFFFISNSLLSLFIFLGVSIIFANYIFTIFNVILSTLQELLPGSLFFSIICWTSGMLIIIFYETLDKIISHRHGHDLQEEL